MERNWVFATNSEFIIPISLEPNVANLWYFKLWSNKIHSLKYLRFTTLESKDIGFRNAEFVAKTQFLWFSEEKKINCLQWFMKVFQSLRLVWSFFNDHSKKTFLFVRCAILFSSLKDKSLKSIDSPRCYPSKGQMGNTYNCYNYNWKFT